MISLLRYVLNLPLVSRSWLTDIQTYEAFARDIVDEQARKRRFKKVGLWSLQLAAQAIFLGMAGNVI